ncbi:MAG: hypothetical protein HBSAPP04_16350 [Ignavibacteriaceae bacterium]|nr:MAG: sigma-70 family RNA polymerase sigma factor [Chlorobiota bacterium]GJQ32796.1 MAG: hypothetical protein HBSAPP04_16350 [Ignavibacteriaceae bacterium]
MSEEKLIELAKTGDRDALRDLVKKYEKTLYSFAFKICRNREKAENVMQETFLSMLRSLKGFDGNSKLSTWLYRISVNHCLMSARKAKKDMFVEPDDDEELFSERHAADWSTIPYKSVENQELREILDRSIDKLAPEYRIVFTLRDVQQLSTEETAGITGLSVPAVKSRLHRARAFLRNEISKEFQR